MITLELEKIDRYYDELCKRAYRHAYPNQDLPEDYKDRVTVTYKDAELSYVIDTLSEQIGELSKKIEWAQDTNFWLEISKKIAESFNMATTNTVANACNGSAHVDGVEVCGLCGQKSKIPNQEKLFVYTEQYKQPVITGNCTCFGVHPMGDNSGHDENCAFHPKNKEKK